MSGILPNEIADFSLPFVTSDNDKVIREALRAIFSRGNLAVNTMAINGNITLDPRWAVFFCDTTPGGFTATLPPANYWGAGKSPILRFTYVAGAANVIIAAAGADTINGAANVLFGAGVLTIYTDGVSKWYAN